MRQIIEQMVGTYNAGFPYAALMLSLAIPDICSCLELPPEANPNNQKKRYIRWYNKHLSEHVFNLSADDFWSLRCGMMHAGVLGNKNQTFDKVFFSLGPSDTMCSNTQMIQDGEVVNVEGRVVGLSLPRLLNTISEVVIEWFESQSDNEVVQRNYAKLVKWHPDGYPSKLPGLMYSTGSPCIA